MLARDQSHKNPHPVHVYILKIIKPQEKSISLGVIGLHSGYFPLNPIVSPIFHVPQPTNQ